MFKNLAKDIVDQNQSVNQASLSKISLPIRFACQMMSKLLEEDGCNNTAQMKAMLDVLIIFWESYFSKYLVCRYI